MPPRCARSSSTRRTSSSSSSRRCSASPARGPCRRELARFGIPASRVYLVLNQRDVRAAVRPDEVERALGSRLLGNIPPIGDRRYTKAVEALASALVALPVPETSSRSSRRRRRRSATAARATGVRRATRSPKTSSSGARPTRTSSRPSSAPHVSCSRPRSTKRSRSGSTRRGERRTRRCEEDRGAARADRLDRPRDPRRVSGGLLGRRAARGSARKSSTKRWATARSKICSRSPTSPRSW